jgi:hypothetical protein
MTRGNKKSKLPKAFIKRLKEKQRTQKAIQSSQERLLEATRVSLGDCKMQFLTQMGSHAKMSEIILDFAEPLLAHAPTAKAQKSAIAIAIMAWNVALLPIEKRTEYLKEMHNKLIGIETAERLSKRIDTIVDFLLDRKERLFSDINRIIVKYECLDTPQGVHLNVASAEAIPKAEAL